MRRVIAYVLVIAFLAFVVWLVLTALVVGLVITLVVGVVGAVLALFGIRPKWAAGGRGSLEDPLGVGVHMEVEEWAEDGRKVVQWSAVDQSWDEMARVLEPFLAAAITGIAEAHPDAPVEWIVFQYEPLRGAVSVFPAVSPSGVESEGRACFLLHSVYLELEYDARLRSGSDASREELTRQVWALVSQSLRVGPAAEALQEARKRHPMRLAGLDYFEGEDQELSRLTESGELAPRDRVTELEPPS
jgi:hypothetical protein